MSSSSSAAASPSPKRQHVYAAPRSLGLCATTTCVLTDVEIGSRSPQSVQRERQEMAFLTAIISPRAVVSQPPLPTNKPFPPPT